MLRILSSGFVKFCATHAQTAALLFTVILAFWRDIVGRKSLLFVINSPIPWLGQSIFSSENFGLDFQSLHHSRSHRPRKSVYLNHRDALATFTRLFPSLFELSCQIGCHYSCVSRENTARTNNNGERIVEGKEKTEKLGETERF